MQDCAIPNLAKMSSCESVFNSGCGGSACNMRVLALAYSDEACLVIGNSDPTKSLTVSVQVFQYYDCEYKYTIYTSSHAGTHSRMSPVPTSCNLPPAPNLAIQALACSAATATASSRMTPSQQAASFSRLAACSPVAPPLAVRSLHPATVPQPTLPLLPTLPTAAPRYLGTIFSIILAIIMIGGVTIYIGYTCYKEITTPPDR